MPDTFPAAAHAARPVRRAHALVRALRAPAGRKWLWLRSLGLVILMRLGLWTLPLRTLQVLVARLARGCYSAPLPPGSAPLPLVQEDVAREEREAERELSWAVGKAARLVPRASCLTQALSLQVLLGRRGLGSRLCIGVRKGSASGFEAHAWVERGGRVLIGGSSEAALKESWTPLTSWDFSWPPTRS